MPKPPPTPDTGKAENGKRYDSPTLGGHTHTDSRGYVHWCYHQCRHRWYLWIPLAFIVQSIAVPLEHLIARWFWTLPILHSLSNWIGWPLT